MNTLCSASRVALAAEPRVVPLDEDPELHGCLSARRTALWMGWSVVVWGGARFSRIQVYLTDSQIT